MTTALIAREITLETLWHADLLCQVCEEAPWTQHAHNCVALLCADCASNEPGIEDACDCQTCIDYRERRATPYCEACGAPLTAEEVAASDPQLYVNCEACSTSRF